MATTRDIWINRYETPTLVEPVAVVGSPGLRSIGKLVVDSLIAKTSAKLCADLYSTHLPAVYQTTPSYAAHPSLPGMGGTVVEGGVADFPKTQFYASQTPPLLLVRGYHANFSGQYAVAESIVHYLKDMGVKRMIVAAGFGTKEKTVVCAANNQATLDKMKKDFDVGVGYKGPFMGFSGLIFGFTKLVDIDAVCLFAGTEPTENDLEFPDQEAADRIVEVLGRVLSLPKP
ncbi:MAG: PAC2 family protein [Candidatus Bathyarchaeia archaeon]|jgi:proteasome assembly chaperone (PAC2) family protein